MSNPDQVVEQMTEYLRTVLEQPHPVFGGLPICPFAQQARINGKIKFFVHPFGSNNALESACFLSSIQQFDPTQHDVLFAIHPDQQAMTAADLETFVVHLNKTIFPLQLVAFGGHPDDPFQIGGVQTRHEPYLNITIQAIAKLKQASDLLRKTKYYNNWTPDQIRIVGHPR